MTDIITTINPKIYQLIPEDRLLEIAGEYKLKLLVGTKKPQLKPLFIKAGVKGPVFDRLVGLLGSKAKLHTFLSKDLEVSQDQFRRTLEMTILELQSRIPDMSDNNLIATVGAILKATGLENQPVVQVNNTINSIDEFLANRSNQIKDSDEPVEAEVEETE